MPTDQELLKELIALAKERPHDNKHYVDHDNLFVLLRSGAQVLMNRSQLSGTYVCQVKYEGFLFIHADIAPIRIYM